MSGIRLIDPATQNPLTVTRAIVGSYGIYGNAAAAWTISNLASIRGTSADGVTLAAGGQVTNGSSGQTAASISGLTGGVVLAGAGGTVTNFGTIALLAGAPPSACAVEISGRAGLVSNNGLIAGSEAGVRLDAGGKIDNTVSGTITGALVGAAAYGAAATVTNGGTIDGAQIGVVLGQGGGLINGSTLNFTAEIIGASGVWATAGSANVRNDGTIIGQLNNGVDLFQGGTVSNGTILNTAATIDGYGIGVRILNTGTGNPAGVVTNFGTIVSTQFHDVFSRGQGVYVATDGRVTNGVAGDTTATILSVYGNGVSMHGASGTVINYGTISGTIGINFVNLVRQETVNNAGTIKGTDGVAIKFAGSTNRLIVHPGAVFVGIVRGAGNDTLELASGSSVGSISGLGTSFTNVGTVAVDTNSRWNLAGSNSLAGTAAVSLGAGATLNAIGSVRFGTALSIIGTGTLVARPTGAVEVGGAGHAVLGRITVDPGANITGSGRLASGVTDNGVINAAGGTLSFGSPVVGVGTVAVESGATAGFGQGETASMRFLSGSNETLLFGAPSGVKGTIGGFGTAGTGNRIDLANFVASGSAFSGGVLTVSSAGGSTNLHFAGSYTLGSFALASDSHGGTNITFA